MNISTKNKYILIRHGQTYWNKNGIMHGQYDIPLNHTGHEQAKKAGIKLSKEKIDICFSSPLKRAKSTALKILKYHRSINIVYDDRLMELNKGLLEGKHLNSEKILKDEDNDILKKFNIESKKQFLKRVKSFINEVEKNHKNKTILIVAHSGTIKMILFAINDYNKPIHKAYYDLHIANGKPYIINKKDKKMKIGLFPMVADILHSGHMLSIEEAKKHCDYLIIALNVNPEYKTTQQTVYERFVQLRAVKWVDEVIPYENSTQDKDMFLSLEYDVYFLGEDHKNEDWELRQDIEKLEKEIIYLNRKHGFSSSRIKENAK